MLLKLRGLSLIEISAIGNYVKKAQISQKHGDRKATYVSIVRRLSFDEG